MDLDDPTVDDPTQETQANTGEGNTDLPQCTGKATTRAWFGTLNNYTDHGVTHQTHFASLIKCTTPKMYIVCTHIGLIKQTPHLHCVIYYENARLKTSMKQINQATSWRSVRSFTGATNYCTRAATRQMLPIQWGCDFDVEQGKIEITRTPKTPYTPYGWTKAFIDEVITPEPDDRTIHWFWEENGGVGKSQLTKYIIRNYHALCVSGKACDIKYVVQAWLPKRLDVVIWNIPRSAAERISFSTMEDLKDGTFCTSKYKGTMIDMMDTMHIIVFANMPPNYEMMSANRWNVKRISTYEPYFI